MIIFKRSLLLAALLAGPAKAQTSTIIKFATLAPEGSSWMKVLSELSQDIEKETRGKLKFKFYPGGVAGDEKDVVKKIRIGQLHAAGFTGVGLGTVAPETRLCDAPWLFRSRSELESVRALHASELKAAIERGGFVLLGWTDLGSVYVFSKHRITTPDDMKKEKMWVWEGDQIAQAAYKALGVNPIALSIIDVMQSLQTGMINGVYGPALGIVALQWHAKLKNIYPVPMAESTGAVLVSKKFYDTLPAEQRLILSELSAKHLKRLNELTAAENTRALETLKKRGLDFGADPGLETRKKYEALGMIARRELAGKLYSIELLEKFEKELAALRAQEVNKN